jgi:hypothetical protein
MMDRQGTPASLTNVAVEFLAEGARLAAAEAVVIRAELRTARNNVVRGLIMGLAAAVAAASALAFLIWAAMLGLVALGLPAWGAALLMAVVLIVLTGVLLIAMRRSFAALSEAPQRLMEQIAAVPSMLDGRRSSDA